MAKVAFLSKTTSEVEQSVTFGLANGIKVVGLLADMPEEIRVRLALHGLSQKVGDSAAGFSKEQNFRGAYSAMQAVLDGLVAGVWSIRAGGSSDLVAALVRLGMAEDEEVAQEMVDSMDEETLKAVASHPDVKKVVAEIKAERAREAAKAAAESAPDLGSILAGIKR
jgi:hypothetical protein